jgi:ABC-2 type transport system permease protein
MFALLLKPKILSLKNSINKKTVIRRLPFVALGVGFWIFLYIGTYKVLFYVRGIEFFGEILSMKLFSMTFFSLLGFMILSNIITAISSFYLSRDIPFLLSKPLEIRDIIGLKSFESILNSSWMVISFIPPVFVAYGISYDVSISYYIYVFLVFIMFTLITGGIGISIAHILTRIFPAKRTRNVLLGLGIILFLLIYFVMRSLIPYDLKTPEDFINSLITFKTESPFMPSYWATEAVAPMLKGKGAGFFFMVILLSNSAFLLLFSSIIGKGLFKGNIERLQPSGENKKRILKNIYPSRSAILYKDAKIFFRDTGQWSQMFIIGALIMVYIYNFKSIPINAVSGLSPFIKEIMVLVNMVLSGLVLAAVAARFIYASVSLEGQAFWIIRTSPIDTKRFMWSKFLYGCIPVTLLMEVLVFLTNLAIGVNRVLMAASLVTVLILSVSISGLGTGFGSIYPKFKYENIASVSMSLGGMVFMLISFSVILITLSLEAWMFYIANVGEGLGISGKIQIAACGIFILFINVAAFYIPMRIGRKKIEEHAE